MTRADVAKEFRKIVVQKVDIDVEKVTEASTLSGLGVDKYALDEILIAAEKMFNLKSSDTRFDGVKTVGQAIDVIAKEM